MDKDKELNLDKANFEHLLETPEFKNFLKVKGFKKEDYEGYIILADGFPRKINWSFKTLAILSTFTNVLKIDRINPTGDHIHLALLLYSMLMEDMLSEDGTQNDRFVQFDNFIKLLPTTPGELEKILLLMQRALDQNKTVSIK